MKTFTFGSATIEVTALMQMLGDNYFQCVVRPAGAKPYQFHYITTYAGSPRDAAEQAYSQAFGKPYKRPVETI